MEGGKTAIFGSNVLFNIIDFLQVTEVIKLERLSKATLNKLNGSQHAVSELCKRLFGINSLEINSSLTFGFFKALAKKTLYSRSSCRIQMVPFYSNGGVYEERNTYSFWMIAVVSDSHKGYCSVVPKNVLVKTAFANAQVSQLYNAPMLLSTFGNFDFKKYKIDEHTYHVPEIPTELGAYLNEKTSFLVLNGFEMVSPPSWFTCPVAHCVIFTSMTDVPDWEQYTGQFHDIDNLYEAEQLGERLGLTCLHKQEADYDTVEFEGSTWPLKPVCWVSYANHTAEFTLRSPVICRYIYYLFIDSNTAAATATPNIDVRYCIPFGRIISLEPEFNVINSVIAEGMPSDNNIISTKASNIISESHVFGFGRKPMIDPLPSSDLGLEPNGVIRLTRTACSRSRHPYHHKTGLVLDEVFSYRQIKLTAFNDQCEFNPPRVVLILEADQLDLEEQDVRLSCSTIEEARRLGAHVERSSLFYNIIEYQPIQASVRPVCWLQINRKDEVEIVVDPIFKWPRQAALVACVLVDGFVKEEYSIYISSFSVLG